MKYVAFFGALLAITTLVLVFAGNKPVNVHSHDNKASSVPAMTIAEQDTIKKGDFPFKKTDAEWKSILTSKEYRILREKGTEFPYTNEFDGFKKAGLYVCAGCGQKLYSSEHKYDSGTGWPSFWKPLADSLVAELEDNSFFMTRTEIVCSNCGGHIGHVFDDGPKPTGLRYCMNSAAMDFIPESEMAAN